MTRVMFTCWDPEYQAHQCLMQGQFEVPAVGEEVSLEGFKETYIVVKREWLMIPKSETVFPIVDTTYLTIELRKK